MLRAELASAAAAVAAAPPDAAPAAAAALDAACRAAFGRGCDAADCVLTSEMRRGERLAVTHALRPALQPARLAALLAGPPRSLRLGAALLQTWEADVDDAARMSAADGAEADAAAAAAAAAGDALHACGAVSRALLAAALALAPFAEDAAAAPPGDEAATGDAGGDEPPQPLRATVVLDELLRGAAAAMRDSSVVARHVRASPSGGAFLALLAKWYSLPDAAADADTAARELRHGATMVLQTLTAVGDGCALLWRGGAARDAVVDRVSAALRAGAEAAVRRPLRPEGYSPARVGEAAALICNCVAAPEPHPAGGAGGAAAPLPPLTDDSYDPAETAAGFARLFCAAGMPGALAALLAPRSALLRPRPDDASALAIVLDALARLAEHPEPRRALFPPKGPGDDVAAPAAAVFVAMAAAARHHPVPHAAAQAHDALRGLAAAAAADVACESALAGVLLVQRAPKGSDASAAKGGLGQGQGQAMQLDPAIVAAASALSRAVGWDAWSPGADGGAARPYAPPAPPSSAAQASQPTARDSAVAADTMAGSSCMACPCPCAPLAFGEGSDPLGARCTSSTPASALSHATSAAAAAARPRSASCACAAA